MHARRAPHPFTVRAVERCVLVLLTLVASLMHLTRSPGAGGLGLTPPAVTRPALAASGPAASVRVLSAGERAAPADTAAHPGDGHHPHQHASPASAADTPAGHAPHRHAGYARTDAAPNAPPGHAEHAGPHCPFCLTASFALAAAPATTLPTVTRPVVPAAVRPAGPAVSAVRHADPRAPPTLA